LSGLHAWAVRELPARTEGYALDLDSFSLIHEDGQQEGVRVGYTRKGLKPCHRPIVTEALPELDAHPLLDRAAWVGLHGVGARGEPGSGVAHTEIEEMKPRR
jgi:hypothetical protein